MENQHRLVKGYRDLSQSEIDAMNSIKLAEQDIGQLFQQIKAMPDVDQRSLALAKTGLQEAFHWFVRAVAKPLDVYELKLPEETYLDRLKCERDDLNEKFQKLSIYVCSSKFLELAPEVQQELTEQKLAMEAYARTVNLHYDRISSND